MGAMSRFEHVSPGKDVDLYSVRKWRALSPSPVVFESTGEYICALAHLPFQLTRGENKQMIQLGCRRSERRTLGVVTFNPLILLHYFTLLVAILTLPACKESPTESVSSRKQLLTKAPWVIQAAFALGPDPGQSTDITSTFSTFTIKFESDGRYSSSLQNGTWELIESETKILFDKNLASQTKADIPDLSESILRLKMSIPINNQLTPIDITFIPTQVPAAINSPDINFETLWKEFDARYSFFEIKHINWDSLYTVYRPQVSNLTGDSRLFQVMSSMLDHLKDGHVSLVTPVGSYFYVEWYSRYPTNFLGTTVVGRYLNTDFGTTAGGYMRFGRIGSDLGYLYIGPNLSGDQATWTRAIDAIIDSLKDTRGIVVDLRSNGGGNDGLGMIVASRFADEMGIYSYVRYRNGPKHSDFTDYQARTIEPQGARQYTRRVALLTNRRCFSSAEGTILMFRALEHVTVIGDTSGGGSANPISLQLPNGWTYRVSRWIQYTAQKKVFEGTGLPPDIPLWIGAADSVEGRDTILERAIQHLRD